MDCKKYWVTYYIYDKDGNSERKRHKVVYSDSEFGAKRFLQGQLNDFNYLIINAEVIGC